MNKLKTLLVVLLALMLAVPCALAEDSTVYSLSLMDPVVVQGDETLLDLTGLNIDLVAKVTDETAQGLSVELYSGEDYGYLTSLQVQFSEEGVLLYLDGMTNSYSLSYDAVASMAGDETAASVISGLPQLLASAAVRSVAGELGTLMQSAIGDVGELFTRWMPVTLCADQISFDENGECVIPISVTQDESLVAVAEVQGMLSSVGIDSDIDFEGLSAEGTMTVYGSDEGYTGYALDITGIVYAEGEEAPYTLTADISDEAMNGQLDITNSEGSVMSLILMPFEMDEETVTDSHVIYCMEDEATVGYLAMQKTADEGDWTDVQICSFGDAEDGSENEVTGVSIVSDYYAEADHSWGITFFNYTGDGSDYQSCYLSYLGVDAQTEEGVNYREGYIDVGMNEGGTQTDVSFRVIEMCTEANQSDWVLNYSDSVDISSMDESALNTAQMGLMGVVGEVGATLQEQYPIFEELFSNISIN